MKRTWKNRVCNLLLFSMLLTAGFLYGIPADAVQAAEVPVVQQTEQESSAAEESTEETTEESKEETTQASSEETTKDSTKESTSAQETTEVPTVPAETEKRTLSAPQNLKVKADSGVNVLTWDAVQGATHYLIYREDPDSALALIVEDPGVTGTTYSDIDILPGRSYKYVIRAVNNEGKEGVRGEYSSEVSAVAIIDAPTLKSATVVTKGVQLKWSALSNVDGYYVYRKTTGSYKLVATITSAKTVSWIDTSVTRDVTYTYTVRGYVNDRGTIYRGRYSSAGIKVKVLLPGPVLKTATASSGKVTVSWGAVSNVNRYYIYRKGNGTTSYKLLGNTTSTSYVDTTVAAGKEYTYTVRAYVKDGSKYVLTGFDSVGVSAVSVVPTPVLSSATISGTTITVKWKAVAGASGYRVYRKVAGGSWVKLKDQKTLTYTDTDTQMGGNYVYTVRAFVQEGTAYRWSSYDKNGLSAKLELTKPTIKSTQTYSGGIVVRWATTDDADGYIVYRKKGNGNYARIAVVVSGSKDYYWNYRDGYSPAIGGTYTYAVRAYRVVDGNTVYSTASYMSSSVVCKPAEPIIASVTADETNDTIVWSTVSGAVYYRIQYKLPGESSWKNETDAAGKPVNITASSGVTTQTRSVTANVQGTVYRVRAYANGVWNTDMTDSASNVQGSHADKKVLFVGDSITYGRTWPSVVSTVTYADVVGRITGCEVVNTGKSGLKVAGPVSSPTTYGLTTTGYDVIVVALGTNDYQGGTAAENFTKSVKTIFSYIHEYNPQAKVVVITPNYRLYQTYAYASDESGTRTLVKDYSQPGLNVANKVNLSLQDYNNILTQIANANGAYVYNSVSAGVLTANNCYYRTADGLHPTQEMYAMMGRSIAQFMEANGVFN